MLGDPALIDSVWHRADTNLKDKGVYPKALGSHFLLHRIDGKLVGVSYITIGHKYLESGYFMYDTDYKFLNLGVMSVVREIEYMRLVHKRYNPLMEFYMLSDLSVNCPKVNYKLNYQPGFVQCPRTKREMPFEAVKATINVIAGLPIEDKQMMPHI